MHRPKSKCSGQRTHEDYVHGTGFLSLGGLLWQDGLNIASDCFHHVLEGGELFRQLYPLVGESMKIREGRSVLVLCIVVTRIGYWDGWVFYIEAMDLLVVVLVSVVKERI